MWEGNFGLAYYGVRLIQPLHEIQKYSHVNVKVDECISVLPPGWNQCWFITGLPHGIKFAGTHQYNWLFTYHHRSRSHVIKTIWQMYLVKGVCIQFCGFSQSEAPLNMFCQVSPIAVELSKFVFLQVEKKMRNK